MLRLGRVFCVLFGFLLPGLVFADLIFSSSFEPLDALFLAVPSPERDALLPADARPPIGAQLSSGSLPASGWRLFVDGIERTEESTVSASGIVWSPPTVLSEATHQAEVRHGSNTLTWSFTLRSPPQVVDLQPQGDVPDGPSAPTLSGRFSDLGAGVDPSRTRLLLDGVDVTAQAQLTAFSFTLQPPAILPDGQREATLEVYDLAGNVTRAGWAFLIGPRPQLVFESPAATVLPFGSRPEIVLRASVSRGSLAAQDIQVFLESEDITARFTVEQAGPGDVLLRYTFAEAPAQGFYQLRAYARSGNGVRELALTGFTIDQERLYRLERVSPAAGAVQIEPLALVEVLVASTPSPGHPLKVRLNGLPPISVREEQGLRIYGRSFALVPGPNTITAEAQFASGESRTLEIPVTYQPVAEVVIDTPLDWSILGPASSPNTPVAGGALDLTGQVARPVIVSGRTSSAVSSVQINQQAAQLSPDGRSFTFPNFFLHEGTNLLNAQAMDAHGRASGTQITVYVDQTAPVLTVESPAPSAITSLQRIDVRGIVNDAVEGRAGAAQMSVRVDNLSLASGVEASVANQGFLAAEVPLVVGRNLLKASARDALGNLREQELVVVRTAVGARRIVAVSGDRQSAPAGTELPRALEIQALNAEGEPLPDHPLQIDLLRGSGSLRAGPQPNRPDGLNPARNLSLLTDAEGLARVWWTLGEDARPGSDVLRVRGDGMAEDVVFVASAEAGAPTRLGLYGTAGMQFVGTDSRPVEALMAQALDAHGNPIADTTVTFQVTDGDARFDARSATSGSISEQGRAIAVQTDRHGVATVRPQTGASPGLIQIRASVPDTDIATSTFQLMSLQRSNGPTGLGGTVMDHDGTPIAGVRLSIDRTPLSVLSAADGSFRFADQVPPGKIDLFVDGRLVQFSRGGVAHEYPALHFEMPIVQGQQNQLPHPIYLPPVSIGRAVTVGGNQDVVLTMPGFEGFSMRVRANSVTFPDGSREGPLVVNAVHADRLPMVPLGTAGQFAGIGWTIQPTNTRFDPPIEVHIPNTEGLAPGRTLPIFQWDHDLATFVPMGHGTVSEDATQIISDPGSGISKAGWGGGGPPPPLPNDGDNQCPVRCPSGFGEGTEPAAIEIRANGETADLFLPQPEAGGAIPVAFSSTASGNCPTPMTTWTLGTGKTAEGPVANESYTGPQSYTVRATLTCGSCCAGASDTIEVALVEVKYSQQRPCEGFDDVPKPPWLFVPLGSTNKTDAAIDPTEVATDVEFRSANTGFATVSPDTAAASPQELTVTGVAVGDTEIESMKGLSGNFGSFKVMVKDRIDKHVSLHVITEENDDTQPIPVNRGVPNQLCLRGGNNRRIDAQVPNTDVLFPGSDGPPAIPETVYSGGDGICDTPRIGDDDPVIPQHQGLPHSACVGAGPNGFRDTANAAGDDVAGATAIDSGPNGVCQTVANNINLVPTDAPNQSSLQQYLNSDIWGKQANVHFTLSMNSRTVNFDLDRDGALDDPPTPGNSFAEVDALRASAYDASADYNIYYIMKYGRPVALTKFERKEAWIGDDKESNVNLITAHELGHLLADLPDTTADTKDLMHAGIDFEKGCKLTYSEWGLVH
ncbi:hypothetical protein C7S18_00150 [Ahniella affigens]|uniref:PKD domain-containing protein n=1 Tax=Ahniella affigens TaxID=2021234 RepID=A0A2P1PLJ1_9GAMM|nr:Ig-like domain-containing protein [Ahniella affigens]AVP95699.1 hypothetical protein C7S18_00150 [Ahniella affigens]